MQNINKHDENVINSHLGFNRKPQKMQTSILSPQNWSVSGQFLVKQFVSEDYTYPRITGIGFFHDFSHNLR